LSLAWVFPDPGFACFANPISQSALSASHPQANFFHFQEKYVDVTSHGAQTAIIVRIQNGICSMVLAEQLKNIKVKCRSCETVFVFTIEEQDFFQSRGFTNVPKDCPGCRAKRQKRPIRTDWHVTCADCGSKTTVPFRPTKHQAVYCRACFTKRKA